MVIRGVSLGCLQLKRVFPKTTYNVHCIKYRSSGKSVNSALLKIHQYTANCLLPPLFFSLIQNDSQNVLVVFLPKCSGSMDIASWVVNAEDQDYIKDLT